MKIYSYVIFRQPFVGEASDRDICVLRILLVHEELYVIICPLLCHFQATFRRLGAIRLPEEDPGGAEHKTGHHSPEGHVCGEPGHGDFAVLSQPCSNIGQNHPGE